MNFFQVTYLSEEALNLETFHHVSYFSINVKSADSKINVLGYHALKVKQNFPFYFVLEM